MSPHIHVERRPAVIVGAELNGLGVCRSLARGNIPTYVLGCRRFDAAMWSRYAIPVRTETLHGPRFIAALRTLQEQLQEHPALIVTDEMALLTVSEFRDELSGLYRFRLPEHAIVVMLHNKAQFHEYAMAHDFPVPESEILRDAAELGRIGRLRLPVVVKPADKRFVHSGDGSRLVIAGDWKTAESASRQLLEATGEVIVQECIEGPDSNIYFCLFYRANGQPTIMFTGRKLASSPPGAGSTAFCAPAGDISRTLEPITHSLLQQVDYQGFGGVEYKWDAVAGRFVIIEPTVGRTDWQEEIATLAGVNIPLAGYCHEYGIPYAAAEPNDGIVWQASHVERIKVGAEAIPAGAPVVDGYWRRDDPVPAFVHYPKDIAVSAPAMARGVARRWGRGLAERVARLAGFTGSAGERDRLSRSRHAASK